MEWNGSGREERNVSRRGASNDEDEEYGERCTDTLYSYAILVKGCIFQSSIAVFICTTERLNISIFNTLHIHGKYPTSETFLRANIIKRDLVLHILHTMFAMSQLTHSLS